MAGNELDRERAWSRKVRRTGGWAGLEGQPRGPLIPGHAGPGAFPRQVVLADAVVLVERVLAVRAAEVTTGGAPLLSDTRFTFDWDEQGTRIRDFDGVMGEGSVTLDAAICCSGPLADKHLTGRITLSGVDLDKIVPAPVAAALGGIVDASAQFDGTGNSLSAIAGAMTGSGSFTIKNGIAETSNLQMTSPLLKVAAAGTVDLTQSTINMLANPEIVAGAEGQGGANDLAGLSVPVRIEGSLDEASGAG